jgi:hypothetical protein
MWRQDLLQGGILYRRRTRRSSDDVLEPSSLLYRGPLMSVFPASSPELPWFPGESDCVGRENVFGLGLQE